MDSKDTKIANSLKRYLPDGKGRRVYPVWQDVTTGRPTVYDPTFCEQVIELGKQGKSTYAHFAAAFQTSKSTITQWEAQRAEFANALNRARAYAEAWWADKYSDKALTDGKSLAQGYACFDMKNRFGWTDQRDVHMSGTVVHQHTAAQQAWKRHGKAVEAIEAEYREIDNEPGASKQE